MTRAMKEANELFTRLGELVEEQAQESTEIDVLEVCKRAELGITERDLQRLEIHPRVFVHRFVPWHVWFPWRPLWCWWWNRFHPWYRCCPWWWYGCRRHGSCCGHGRSHD